MPPAKAGVGSAINDTARNLGSVLGIAVIGSIVTSAYRTALAAAPVPARVERIAGQSVGAAVEIAHRLPDPLGRGLTLAAHYAFVHAANRGVLTGAVVTAAGLIIAARTLPGRARSVEPRVADVPAHANA